MNRKLKKFLETEFQSKAQVLDRRMVEVVAPDGEIFHINSTIGAYDSEDTQRYYLHVIESIFDKNFSDDKETMSNRIWRDMQDNSAGKSQTGLYCVSPPHLQVFSL